MGFIGFHGIFLDLTGIFLVLPVLVSLSFHTVLMVFIGFHRLLMVITDFHGHLLVFTEDDSIFGRSGET